MGRAMFTIIGAMAELESSLISEPVTAGIRPLFTRILNLPLAGSASTRSASPVAGRTKILATA
jgi:hypothetical protein